jgi:hypothetical protein
MKLSFGNNGTGEDQAQITRAVNELYGGHIPGTGYKFHY